MIFERFSSYLILWPNNNNHGILIIIFYNFSEFPIFISTFDIYDTFCKINQRVINILNVLVWCLKEFCQEYQVKEWKAEQEAEAWAFLLQNVFLYILLTLTFQPFDLNYIIINSSYIYPACLHLYMSVSFFALIRKNHFLLKYQILLWSHSFSWSMFF